MPKKSVIHVEFLVYYILVNYFMLSILLFQVFWSYIVGMLSNLECMPIERIHSMLRMFAMQGTSAMECSLQELKLFLDRKVKEQSLILSGGVYRLPKTN